MYKIIVLIYSIYSFININIINKHLHYFRQIYFLLKKIKTSQLTLSIENIVFVLKQLELYKNESLLHYDFNFTCALKHISIAKYLGALHYTLMGWLLYFSVTNLDAVVQKCNGLTIICRINRELSSKKIEICPIKCKNFTWIRWRRSVEVA